jgi:guanylate kinase
MPELERRLRGRGTEDEAAVSKRLANARGEMAESEAGYWNCRLVNNDLGETFEELKSVVSKECLL